MNTYVIYTREILSSSYYDSCVLYRYHAIVSFSLLEERGKHVKDAHGGIQTYTIDHYSDLDELLGKQWHMRVLNINGDFSYIISYIILGTISFHHTRGRPISEYEAGADPENLEGGAR